MSWP